MEKKYNLPEENKDQSKLSEPAITYERTPPMTFSPSLTEDELADAITGEELVEAVCNHIHELFSKK